MANMHTFIISYNLLFVFDHEILGTLYSPPGNGKESYLWVLLYGSWIILESTVVSQNWTTTNKGATEEE